MKEKSSRGESRNEDKTFGGGGGGGGGMILLKEN